MRSRAAYVAALAAGAYTPFQAAFWDDSERELVRRWRDGDDLDGAAEELCADMLRAYGEGWSGRPANLGRSGLQLVLEALELPPGSEVIVPSYACAGVASPVLHAGHRPVLVDVDEELNISLASVLRADAPSVRAVVVPHFGGLWARDAEAIFEWARSRSVVAIEDVAQAQGLTRHGRPAGSFADVAMFSFGGGKMLFGPGGGLVTTRDPELGARLDARPLRSESRSAVSERVDRFLAEFAAPSRRRSRAALRERLSRRLAMNVAAPAVGGHDPRSYDVFEISPIEAALAHGQLRKLDRIVAARKEHASAWHRLLGDAPGLRPAPLADNVATHLWLSVDGDDAARPAELRSTLTRHGVETETLYVPLHLRPEFAGLRTAPLPVTERSWRRVFALPTGPTLGRPDHRRIERAAAAIRASVRAIPR